eukprot:scaffold480827_cov21-Prasinocladus_malaysianus.AAC.1
MTYYFLLQGGLIAIDVLSFGSLSFNSSFSKAFNELGHYTVAMAMTGLWMCMCLFKNLIELSCLSHPSSCHSEYCQKVDCPFAGRNWMYRFVYRVVILRSNRWNVDIKQAPNIRW